MYHCKMSVHSLVEFVYQSGDLIASSSSIERANLGSRIHRQLQGAAKGDYTSEVYLKLAINYEDIRFEIEGRADGILREESGVTLEEIKTTAIPYDDINDQHFVHFAQAYCYGYMYLQEHDLAQITIQLTYYQITDNQTKLFQQIKTREELQTFFNDTLARYLTWARLSKEVKTTSIASLKELQFPFPEYRQGQRTFAVAVYKTILDKDILFAQAPTGIGKTISTLFPALKAIGEGKVEKIFYLCAKNITASVAYDTIQLLYNQHLSFKTVGITAKDKICFLEKRDCDPKICPYANGYYDRSGDALYELLSSQDFLIKETIEKVARLHEVCPFELSLDASLYADVIVGDYNYVFDPRVYLKRFFTEKGDYVFLVDEAHNLVDRAREMYSADLCKASFLDCKRLLPKDRKALHSSLQVINNEFLEQRKNCEERNVNFLAQKEPIVTMKQKLLSFIEHMDAYLQSDHDDKDDEQLRDLYFQSINYNKIADFYDEHFVTTLTRDKNDVKIRQFCMNPRNPLADILKKGKATIFFSATLSPIDYFLSLLGGDEKTKRLSLPSPFPQEHCMLIIDNQISTRYHQRESSLLSIIERIYTCVSANAKPGNYIIFTPSYAYMNQIAGRFIKEYPNITVSKQDSCMKEEEKQAFLKQFDITEHLHLHFCVLGGMFSEGIDLKGDKLIGAIIIGVGLPQINPQQDLIKDHFEEQKQMGYAYAYQFPGMNKVLQAAGRVIRSQEDKGIIYLIDERYTSYQYKKLLPSHMLHYQVIHDRDALKQALDGFWKKEESHI